MTDSPPPPHFVTQQWVSCFFAMEKVHCFSSYFFKCFLPLKVIGFLTPLTRLPNGLPRLFYILFFFFPITLQSSLLFEKKEKFKKRKNDFVVSDFFFHHQFDPPSIFFFLRNQTLDGSVIQSHSKGKCIHTNPQWGASRRRSSVYTWTATSSFLEPLADKRPPFVLLVSIAFKLLFFSVLSGRTWPSSCSVLSSSLIHYHILFSPLVCPTFAKKHSNIESVEWTSTSGWSTIIIISLHFDFVVFLFFCSSVAVGFVRFRACFSLSLSFECWCLLSAIRRLHRAELMNSASPPSLNCSIE